MTTPVIASLFGPELLSLRERLGSQRKVALLLGMSEEWLSRTLAILERGDDPHVQFATEQRIHTLAFVAREAWNLLGPLTREWLFIPRAELADRTPGECLPDGRDDVMHLLRRDAPFLTASSPQLASISQTARAARQAGASVASRPTFEELDQMFAGKRVAVEDVIYRRSTSAVPHDG